MGRQVAACLEGEIGQEAAAARTIQRTKSLARRQLAWFRRDPRVRWFGADEEGAPAIVDQLMRYLRIPADNRSGQRLAAEVR